MVDEYHLHPDNSVYASLKLGMGARPEPLLFAITTAGTSMVSACKRHYDYCCEVLAGRSNDESLFALIYELDNEDELDKPNLWIKANPNLGVSLYVENLQEDIQQAKGISTEWNGMLTKRFNVWCQGDTTWLGSGVWDSCRTDYKYEDFAGLNCYAGLDLSSNSDITSLCYSFPIGNKIRIFSRHYIPESELHNPANKNRSLYIKWSKDGWLKTTPGNCIDFDRIRDDILKDAEEFNIKLIGYDVWNATQLRTQLQGAGFDVEPFAQNFQRYSPAAKSFEVYVNREVIQHNGDPVLAWAIGNVVMGMDANANVKPNKKKSANKIDPAIACLMSFGTLQAEHEEFDFDVSGKHKEKLKNFNGI